MRRSIVPGGRHAVGLVALGFIVATGTVRAADESEIELLIRQLQSPNTSTRLASAARVAELGPDAAKTIPALIEALKCERIEVLFPSPQVAGMRQRLAEALVRIGPSAVPRLQQAIEHENGLIRVWAAWSLWQIDPERSALALPVLIAALDGPNEMAADAAGVIERAGEAAAPAAAALIEQLDHHDLATRCSMVHALTALIQPADLSSLEDSLSHSNPLVRVGAGYVWQRVAPEPSDKLWSVFIAALKDGSPQVRQQAVWAAGQLGERAAPLVPALIDALPSLDPNPGEYFFGGGRLGRESVDPSIVLAAIGPPARSDLITALAHDDPRTRVMAAVALGRIDPAMAARTAPILAEARESKDQSVRFLAELSGMPGEATGQGDDLDGLITAALNAGGFGPPSPAMGQVLRRGAEAVPRLMEVLGGPDGQMAGRASRLLSQIGAPALEPLQKAMDSENDRMRVFAVRALAGLGEPAVPVLIEALEDDVYPVRRAARSALQAIGTPEAREALELPKLN